VRLLIFGYGYSARALTTRLRDAGGWRIAATSRDPATRADMAADGLDALDPADADALASAARQADAVLATAAPTEEGCPALAALRPALSARTGAWLGYLSTTGVYGDRGGGWADERTPVAPASPEARRRVAAEAAWRELADATGARLSVFRLPGIYGPGRSALDRVGGGETTRWAKPGHVFSRIHVDDIASGVAAALARPQRAGVFNLCDDEPAPASDVTAFAAHLLGAAPPPEAPLDLDRLSPMARRFWSENRRVANARAKAALGWRPRYPTYREGLAAIAGAKA
jgi:nucleoside-diphosphate-sugar epimerase